MPSHLNIKLHLLNFLRTKVEGVALPKNEKGGINTLHIKKSETSNVQGIYSGNQTQNVQRRQTQPIYDVKAAKNALFELWLDYDADLLDALYSDYSRLISHFELKPTKREGRAWLYRQIVVIRKREVTATVVDAMLVLFNLHLEHTGILRSNPVYTGRAPYPRYLVGGVHV